MRKLILAGGILALLLAALCPVAAWWIDRTYGRDLIVISPWDKDIVELNQALWSKGESIAKIYGTPTDKPIRVVWPKESDLIVPVEDTSLVFLKGGGDLHVTQAQTVHVIAKYSTIGFGAAGLFFIAVFAVLRFIASKKSANAAKGTPA